MFNNSINFFLIFLSIYATSSTYGMNFLRNYAFTKTQEAKKEQAKKANENLANIINEFLNLENPTEKAENEFVENIDTNLKQGADINLKVKGSPLIVYANSIGNPDLFNRLMDMGVNITRCTPDLFSSILSKSDCIKLEKLLQRKIDPNFTIKYRNLTFLHLAALNNNTKFMKLLLEYGADINYDYVCGLSLLGRTMCEMANEEKSINGVKKLCQFKASLTDLDNQSSSVFHLAVDRYCPSQMISTVLINARFDEKKIDDEELDKQLKQTVKTALLVFECLKIPKDIQLLVFDKLTLDYDIQGFNQILSRFLYSKGYSNHLITQAKKRKEKFKEIAEIKNRKGESALDLLNTFLASTDKYLQLYGQDIRLSIKQHRQEHAQSIQPLLTGEQYDHDIAEFIQNNGKVSKDNLVLAPLYN